ncbi:MAG TPA: AAA family ATPase, partial [Acidobacteriota bacterium]|nr:AAA family ATPase [Acidobacteriota bacterium]
PASDHVMSFAAKLVLATHPDSAEAPEFIRQYVRYGSSPRGAQALVLSAKIRALKDGRYNASAEDVRAAALPSLRHRLILNIEGQAENISTDDLLRRLLEKQQH